MLNAPATKSVRNGLLESLPQRRRLPDPANSAHLVSPGDDAAGVRGTRMADPDRPVPRGRIRPTMPLAVFTTRAAGGRVVAGFTQAGGGRRRRRPVPRTHRRALRRIARALQGRADEGRTDVLSDRRGSGRNRRDRALPARADAFASRCATDGSTARATSHRERPRALDMKPPQTCWARAWFDFSPKVPMVPA